MNAILFSMPEDDDDLPPPPPDLHLLAHEDLGLRPPLLQAGEGVRIMTAALERLRGELTASIERLRGEEEDDDPKMRAIARLRQEMNDARRRLAEYQAQLGANN